ncbi:hypothetical protein BpHYR1_050053 [Brachionus plicatilis]|uniref:MULE transposase domain-containing protein n=1 Tax=Brachionus plicatilis TaxID=10195 RepID=A0A3M7P3P5_BRAPC|nr:hypothetical protein BpHYR1_050053 [Brachionus plicatilis]
MLKLRKILIYGKTIALDNPRLAMIQAISVEFENVKIYDCWFHFNQAIIRYLALYYNDYNFKQCIRKFSGLALVPLKDFFVNTWLQGKHGYHGIIF